MTCLTYTVLLIDLYCFQASQAHILSIALIVNEKFRERVPMWDVSIIVIFCWKYELGSSFCGKYELGSSIFYKFALYPEKTRISLYIPTI